jgi:hypothetical protein
MTCAVCHDPERPAEIGQACRRCWARMAAALRPLGIPALIQDLASLGYVARDRRDPDRRDEHGEEWPHFDQIANALPAGPINSRAWSARVSGSATPPIPIRIDPVDLTGPARPATWTLYARGLLGLDDDQIGTLSVATILWRAVAEWAAALGHAELELPRPTVPIMCAWLRERLDWACEHHPRIADFADELRELQGVLLAANGLIEAPPKLMEARCPSCGNLGLHQAHDEAHIECATCPAVVLSPAEYADYARTLIAAELTRRHPPMPPTGDLATIRAALIRAEQHCRYHDQEFERLGLESWGEPRCDSCKQPWRVVQALAAVDGVANQVARAGYEQAISTLLDVAQRVGSPAARWAADYLVADPDRRAPAPAEEKAA